MRWSWRIARIAGIDVYVHVTFVILLFFFMLVPLSEGGIADAMRQLIFLVALFSIVVLHELGHAMAARKFGIRTRDIILLPIGGVARLERMPEDPKQELIVAFAGPAVNFVLAMVCFLMLFPLGGLIKLGAVRLASGAEFVNTLITINLFLAFFNLVPAFPMDGGRVLRALLALRIDYVRATHVAAVIGQGVAILFGLIGLFGSQPMLLFIAFFVWIGAAEEASMVQMKSALGGIPISRVMITEFHVLSPLDTLEKAVAFVLSGFQHDFPVEADGALVGVLTRADLMAALAAQGIQTRVADVMKREFQTADPGEMIESVFVRLQECECHALPIVRAGRLLGMVTMDNVGEFMMVQSALRGARRPFA